MALVDASAHVFAKWQSYVYRNLILKREWYHGLPYGWWWGKTHRQFLEQLPKHLNLDDEPKWFSKRYESPIGPNGENYNTLYYMCNYKGKVVLDVGADYGSSACWFLERGAKQVIAVEKSDDYFEGLKRYAEELLRATGDNKVIPIKLKVNTGKDCETLLTQYNPPIVKMDCEGCETFLLQVPDPIFSIPEEYLIETHTVDLAKAFLTKLAENYDAKIVVELHPPWCNIIYAKRKVKPEVKPKRKPRKVTKRHEASKDNNGEKE